MVAHEMLKDIRLRRGPLARAHADENDKLTNTHIQDRLDCVVTARRWQEGACVAITHRRLVRDQWGRGVYECAGQARVVYCYEDEWDTVLVAFVARKLREGYEIERHYCAAAGAPVESEPASSAHSRARGGGGSGRGSGSIGSVQSVTRGSGKRAGSSRLVSGGGAHGRFPERRGDDGDGAGGGRFGETGDLGGRFGEARGCDINVGGSGDDSDDDGDGGDGGDGYGSGDGGGQLAIPGGCADALDEDDPEFTIEAHRGRGGPGAGAGARRRPLARAMARGEGPGLDAGAGAGTAGGTQPGGRADDLPRLHTAGGSMASTYSSTVVGPSLHRSALGVGGERTSGPASWGGGGRAPGRGSAGAPGLLDSASGGCPSLLESASAEASGPLGGSATSDLASYATSLSLGRGPQAREQRKGSTDICALARFFHLPINEASRATDICATVLKKICRAHNIPRWPQRRLQSDERKLRRYFREFDSGADRAASAARVEEVLRDRARHLGDVGQLWTALCGSARERAWVASGGLAGGGGTGVPVDDGGEDALGVAGEPGDAFGAPPRRAGAAGPGRACGPGYGYAPDPGYDPDSAYGRAPAALDLRCGLVRGPTDGCDSRPRGGAPYCYDFPPDLYSFPTLVTEEPEGAGRIGVEAGCEVPVGGPGGAAARSTTPDLNPSPGSSVTHGSAIELSSSGTPGPAVEPQRDPPASVRA